MKDLFTVLRLDLRRQRRSIVFTAVIIAIYYITFALYGLPLKAVLYPTALAALAAAVFGICVLRRRTEEWREMRALDGMCDVIQHRFPEVTGASESELIRIIHMLCDEELELERQARSKFAENVDYYTAWAHQIKTPIASMRLCLQNEDSPIQRSLSRDLSRIEQYADMVMVHLRLDSDTTDYVIEKCDLDPIIKSAVRRFAGEFIYRGLKLRFEATGAVVLTDRKWLQFVLEQIIGNALKYTPEGEIVIELSPPCTLSVRDTGIGISPEDLPRIFERSYTGTNGRRGGNASGIGLYLCQKVCRRLGHGISAASTPGVGTCIMLDLSRDEIEVE